MSTSTAESPAEAITAHVCAFERLGKLFGFAANTVTHITPLPGLTVVPSAPPFVRGAMNLRGDIVPVLSIDESVGLPGQEGFAPKSPVIVLQTKLGLVGVLVDRVLAVANLAVNVTAGDIEGTGDTTYVSGICEHEGRMVTLLDQERLVADFHGRLAPLSLQ